MLKLIQGRNKDVTLCIGGNQPQNIALLPDQKSPEDGEMSACFWKYLFVRETNKQNNPILCACHTLHLRHSHPLQPPTLSSIYVTAKTVF